MNLKSGWYLVKWEEKFKWEVGLRYRNQWWNAGQSGTRNKPYTIGAKLDLEALATVGCVYHAQDFLVRDALTRLSQTLTVVAKNIDILRVCVEAHGAGGMSDIQGGYLQMIRQEPLSKLNL